MKKPIGWRLSEDRIKETKKAAIDRDLPIEDYLDLALANDNEKTKTGKTTEKEKF